MSKTKTTSKTKASSKGRQKIARGKKAQPAATRANSKQAAVLALLNQPKGSTIAAAYPAAGSARVCLPANNLGDYGRHRDGKSHRDGARSTTSVFMGRTGAASPAMNARVPAHQPVSCDVEPSLCIGIWILKTVDQRLAPKISWLPPTIQKIAPQRLRNLSLSPGKSRIIRQHRTQPTETRLRG